MGIPGIGEERGEEGFREKGMESGDWWLETQVFKLNSATGTPLLRERVG